MEKTHQIVRMTEIYSRAASVLIWLGSDDRDVDGVVELVDQALQLIPEVVDDPKKTRESAELLGHRNAEGAEADKSNTKHLDWKPLRSLLNHSCNPRDHILGILGHASDVEKDSIISQDNLHSLSVQECYLRIARSQLLEKHNFAVLALAPQKLITDALAPWYLRPYLRWQKRRLPGLPSWVPDLRNQEIDTLPSYTVRYGKFSAGGATPGRVEIVDDKILECTGIFIDTVKEDGVFFPELPFPPKPKRVPFPLDRLGSYHSRNAWRSLNFYRQCVKLACGSEDIDEMSPERLNSFWRTMTCERSQLSDRIDIDMSDHLKTMIKGMEVWLNSEDVEEAERARVRFVLSAQSVEMSVLSAAAPRRFSTTAEGRLCMIPREGRKGDRVCLLLGSEVPFVLRPTGAGMYEVVGDAYVSGVMDGEALTSGKYPETKVTLV
ncbi:heterokaryon incompatibility protein [Colletotrichum asianum]